MSARGIIRTTLPLVCLVASALAIYNVNSDNTEVVKMAERIACDGECVKTLRVDRGPLSQSFVFQTSLERQTKAEVKCQREFLLLGEYSCTGVSIDH